MATVQLMVNLEPSRHRRSKAFLFHTPVLCRCHHFLSTHSLPLPRSEGSTQLVGSYMNPIPLHPATQNELPSSRVFTGVKGHVTSPGPSHLSQGTSPCPYSGLRGPQHSGSSDLTCCSSVTPSAAHLRPRYLLFLLPGTLSTKLDLTPPSGLCPVRLLPSTILFRFTSLPTHSFICLSSYCRSLSCPRMNTQLGQELCCAP